MAVKNNCNCNLGNQRNENGIKLTLDRRSSGLIDKDEK